MKSWQDKPVEVSYLLNPSFCGELFRRSMKKYKNVTSNNLPYPLIFLILPIVLHKVTRDKMPSTARKKMHTWLQENPEVKINFAKRANNLVPITKETIIFLLQLNAIEIDDKGNLKLKNYRRKNITSQKEGEVANCYRKAEIIGHWFGKMEKVSTIYTMWGVRP
ncbi:three component ABC system middle component [Orenia marismortui]|uniref:Uncharacterized protein n=1 Tax=Orenia marismortui TaxID=46469 RepID=A0A4R8GJB2_9FIRM|nr:three component ABC system middle component [Orenia marismortui]TDX44478.1 hypothetical protein C7959_1546 [Orenia marismortui]